LGVTASEKLAVGLFVTIFLQLRFAYTASKRISTLIPHATVYQKALIF
jgi:hypothetical protein